MKLKTVTVPRGYNGLHCEVAGCIVNIYVGLSDSDGRAVTSVSIAPDRYSGESWEVLDGGSPDGVQVRVGKVEP